MCRPTHNKVRILEVDEAGNLHNNFYDGDSAEFVEDDNILPPLEDDKEVENNDELLIFWNEIMKFYF